MSIDGWLGVRLYLLGGLIFLAAMFLWNLLLQRHGESSPHWLSDGVDQQTGLQRLFDWVTAFLGILLVWPLFLIVIIALALGDREDSVPFIQSAPADEPVTDPYGDLIAQRGKLRVQMSIDSIESASICQDNLDGVPQLPFGHLNAAWQSFKARRIPGDEVWRFDTASRVAPCLPALEGGPPATSVTGFAVLRAGHIVDEFIDGYD